MALNDTRSNLEKVKSARMLLGHFSLRHIDEEFSSAGIKQTKYEKICRYAKKPDDRCFWNVAYYKGIKGYCCHRKEKG